jgi:uncharacterized protein YecA (UPF0149 family)
MNTKTQDSKTSKPSEEQEEVGHVHGPNCNHSHTRLEPLVRLSPKVGRNDDCPCGSLKKFKKCCGK